MNIDNDNAADANQGQTEEELQGVREAEAPVNIDIPEALRAGMSPEKLAEVRAKLASFITKQGKTQSGSEDPDSPPVPQSGGVDGDKPVGKALTGADVDWSEYDLNYSVRHLYPKAVFRETPQGPKWVALLEEFYTTERDAKNYGKMVNIPGSNDKEEVEPVNLGEYLTQMVNGPDGWSIASIMPGSNGRAIVILRKQAPYVLPDPKPLNKMEEVEAPRDQELQATEEAALAFAAEEGLTPPPVVEDDGTGEAVLEAGEDNEAALHAAEEFARRALPRGAVEVEEGTGALPARDSQLISRAIDINRAETLPPPVPTGIQPDAFPPDQGQQGERFVGAAGIENIRAGMRNLLDTDALPNA